jgi:hypothetical protein
VLPYTHLGAVVLCFVSHFCISYCFKLFLFCVAFGTNASGGGDVAWSLTTLYDPVGMQANR